MSKADDFIRDLTALSRRYGLWVVGCGEDVALEEGAEDTYVLDGCRLRLASELPSEEELGQRAQERAEDEERKAALWAEQRRRWDEEAP